LLSIKQDLKRELVGEKSGRGYLVSRPGSLYINISILYYVILLIKMHLIINQIFMDKKRPVVQASNRSYLQRRLKIYDVLGGLAIMAMYLMYFALDPMLCVPSFCLVCPTL